MRLILPLLFLTSCVCTPKHVIFTEPCHQRVVKGTLFRHFHVREVPFTIVEYSGLYYVLMHGETTTYGWHCLDLDDLPPFEGPREAT